MESTALGKKLFLNLLIRAFTVLYLFPEGRRTNGECPGWILSTLISIVSSHAGSCYIGGLE